MKRKKMPKFTIRAFFTLFIIVELLLIDIIASIVITVLHDNFACISNLPKALWLILISIVLGSAITTLMARFFFDPLLKLGAAMRKVAQGDYDVTLKTNQFFPELRQINQDFNVMAEKLGSTEILQTEFISNVSHDFKTPINAIEGYTTLLQDSDQPISPEQSSYIDKILFNTKRLTHLVGNILLLSKVDNPNVHASISTFRLDEQIRQSIVSLESCWIKKDTEFDVDLERVYYTGNEALLMHVWNNLIENAIKYGPEQGLVRMKLWKQDESIFFTIEDEGPGISEEARQHIFDRFYQADNSRKEEGNGLGLALVKQILKRESGNISVESLPEKGTRFTVRLLS